MFEHSRILQSIFLHSKLKPNKVALICDAETVTYVQLMRHITENAVLLKKNGVAKHNIVALSANKGLDFIYAYFALHALGAIAVVVDPESNSKKIDYILTLTKPVVCVGFNHGKVRSVMYEQLRESIADELSQESGLSQDDTADTVFTTGTTGNPKGVLLSHFNIFSSADNINGFIGNREEDVEVLGLPLCHSFGLGRLRCNMLLGSTLVILPGFANVRLFFNAIEKYNATGFGMVPAVWAYICKFSGRRIAKYASQIRYIEIGSAPMPLKSKEELCDLFPDTRICHHYGLTEASRNAFMEYHEYRNNLNSIGRAVCDKVSIKIMDDNGAELPIGELGEICVKGNMVMKGYFLSCESNVAFWGDYFRTGDEGFRDEDGNLYLVSRKKEMINVGGKKVSPVEIEDAIISLGVEDCVVVGISDPDGILGEVSKAYILKDGCNLSLKEIKDKLSGVLEHYKIPVDYAWINEIPKTSSGKKQRLELKN